MRNTSLGLTFVEIGTRKIKIFDRERTIVDAFRYLDIETALKTLQSYLQASTDYKPDAKKLLEYGNQLRVDLSPYILAFTP